MMSSVLQFVDAIWEYRNTYMAELQGLLLPHQDRLRREDKNSLLEPFFADKTDDSDDDWRHAFLPLMDKTGHAKKLYDAKVEEAKGQAPLNLSLLGAKAAQASSYAWDDVDQKSRKSQWMTVIKGAIVEEQRSEIIRRPILTKTAVGLFRQNFEKTLSHFAVPYVRDGKNVYVFRVFDRIKIPDVSTLPPLQKRSFAQRIASVSVESTAADHRVEINKIVKAVRSSGVATFSGEKNKPLEMNVYYALEGLVKVSCQLILCFRQNIFISFCILQRRSHQMLFVLNSGQRTTPMSCITLMKMTDRSRGCLSWATSALIPPTSTKKVRMQ
jgi:hypothetical protein